VAEQAYTAAEIARMTDVHKTTIARRAKKDSWLSIKGNGKGGNRVKYPLVSLPPQIQNSILIYIKDGNPENTAQIVDLLPALAPSVASRVVADLMPVPFGTFVDAITAKSGMSSWTPETAINEQDLLNPRIRNILAILREVEAMPRDWTKGRRKYIEAIALKHEIKWQTIYRWLKKYDKRGIAGLRHEKSTKDKGKVWTPAALDFWKSLCWKTEHRGVDKKDLYEILAIEARREGWRIGGYESANWWFKKHMNPLMEAMQRGGLRALDNLLPPILRDYSDLAPFEILVGDQHRFNRWVMDEETGEVFRPEGYLWQDLRTRIIYGAAVDRKYDSWLIGLALRIGIACYGAFGSIYTDNGKPECSKFLTGILANLRGLGMEWERTEDAFMDVLDVDGEDIDPHYTQPGTHRKAVVKNAKAKMIEGTFHRLDRIMESTMLLPGRTKRLTDDIHWQDVDQQEAISLAKQGRLLTDREHALAMYLACDYYNRQKSHRGVLREWEWKPKPKEATPYDCLMACHEEGWQPLMIASATADMIFLAKDSRIVHQGRINFNSDFYEHDALMEIHKERVDIRYNPMILDELHVFQGGKYLCTATPLERSSMKDMDLAGRKIAEKRERRKKFAAEFRKVSSLAPDFRAYSRVPEADRVAALIGDEKKKRAAAQIEFTRPLTQEALDKGVEQLERLNARLPDGSTAALPRKKKEPPPRPGYWISDTDRYFWCLQTEIAGGTLSDEDQAFVKAEEAKMTPAQRDRWQFERECGAS